MSVVSSHAVMKNSTWTVASASLTASAMPLMEASEQVTQMSVQANQSAHPDRDIYSWRQVRNRSCPLDDDLVRLGLDLGAPTPYKWAADQQEER